MKKDSQISKKPAADSSDKAGKVDKRVYQTLNIMGDEYQTLLTKKYEMRTKWQKPNEKHIISFIPGTITEIFVKEGQTVKKGERILMLEAMKMLNAIEIPFNGKIKKIHVAIGDRIPKGTLMIEIA
jgi:biotin carboxyl carrier protein